MSEQVRPTTPTAPTTPTVATTPQDGSDLTGLSYAQLAARLNELQGQRQTIANRRDALSRQYEGATGANREGAAARLTIMDKSIVDMEADIARVAHEMVIKAPVSSESQIPRGFWRNDQVAGVGFTVFFGTLLLSVLLMRRYVRRQYGRRPDPQASVQSGERLDRIEHAVDAIAIEIERVSENQRFITKLMSERKVGG